MVFNQLSIYFSVLDFWQIAERSAQLHEALLHCGRFQDALESLLSWLTDTEELVANQKPPSAEFKVVKAQIQEQKVSFRYLARSQKVGRETLSSQITLLPAFDSSSRDSWTTESRQWS